jgi:endonuclease/exonuclease/phosphatase (EEP) superfamily protein YafD
MSRFRVLQFNMQFGQLWDAGDADRVTIDLAATLAEIRRHDADVILLQEVEHAQPGGLQLQPPPNFTWLRAELPDYQSCFAYPKADPRELPFGLGLAIFSRGPIRDLIQLDLPSPPIEFDFFGNKTTPTDRLLIGAKVMLHGRELQCFNTHLLALCMLGDGKTDSPWQRNLVADQISEATGPALLTGDFNEQRSEILIDLFGRYGFKTAQSAESTWRRRELVLDHIFYNTALRLIRCQVLPSPASDHHALVADFEFID